MPASSLRAQRVCFSFSDRVLLKDATFHLRPGWTGLVGANGCGKSTLLRLLAGDLVPDAGQVQLEPGTARVVLCDQRVDEDARAEAVEEVAHDFARAERLRPFPFTLSSSKRPSSTASTRGEDAGEGSDPRGSSAANSATAHADPLPESGERELRACVRIDVPSQGGPIAQLAGAREGTAARLRGQLALDPAALARWPTLSAGERRRWQLGAALWLEPDVLLLDEPGNHLDGAATALLLAALKRFDGVGVLVSHDRSLLDALTTATLRLRDGELRCWPGAWSAASAAWTVEERALADARDEAQRRLERTQRSLAAKRREVEAATRGRSTGQRMRNRHDSDARGMGADLKAQYAEASLSRAQRRLAAKAEATEEALSRLAVHREAGRALFLRFQRCPRPVVLALDVPALRTPDGARELLGETHLQVPRDARIAVTGPNGAGKSTLLAALLRGGDPSTVLHLPQELTPAEARADLEALRALPADVRGRALQAVAALGVAPEHLLRTATPSPGEARKLRLALGLGRQVWALLLDEPTNHLDLPAVERLEAALEGYPGALLLVSHDAALVRRLARTTWRFGEGRIHIEESERGAVMG